MLIIEMVLLSRNINNFLPLNPDSSALIHNILLSTHDSALIPPP